MLIAAGVFLGLLLIAGALVIWRAPAKAAAVPKLGSFRDAAIGLGFGPAELGYEKREGGIALQITGSGLRLECCARIEPPLCWRVELRDRDSYGRKHADVLLGGTIDKSYVVQCEEPTRTKALLGSVTQLIERSSSRRWEVSIDSERVRVSCFRVDDLAVAQHMCTTAARMAVTLSNRAGQLAAEIDDGELLSRWAEAARSLEARLDREERELLLDTPAGTLRARLRRTGDREPRADIAFHFRKRIPAQGPPELGDGITALAADENGLELSVSGFRAVSPEALLRRVVEEAEARVQKGVDGYR